MRIFIQLLFLSICLLQSVTSWGANGDVVFRTDVGGTHIAKFKSRVARSVINAIEQNKLELVTTLVDEKIISQLGKVRRQINRLYKNSIGPTGFPQFVRDTSHALNNSFMRVYSMNRGYKGENGEVITIELVFDESKYNLKIQNIVIHKGIHTDASESPELYMVQCGQPPRAGPSIGMLVDFETGAIEIPRLRLSFIGDNEKNELEQLEGITQAYGFAFDVTVYDGSVNLELLDDLWKTNGIESLTIQFFQQDNYDDDFLERLCALNELKHLKIDFHPYGAARYPAYKPQKEDFIPSCIFENPTIETLELTDFRTEIPMNIEELSSLKMLRLSGEYSSLPANIEKLRNLKTLDLSSSKMVSIPEAVFKNKSIELLTLKFPCVKEISPDISGLERLSKLRLQNMDSLLLLPNSLNLLRNLKSIQFDNFNYLPKVAGTLKHLDSLILDNVNNTTVLNDFEGISFLSMERGSDSILHIDLSILKELKKLKITDYEKLKIINGKYGSEQNLESIYISKTSLSHIPDFLQGLDGIIHLEISSSQIEELPRDLTSWSNLESLNLSRNRIETITSSLLALINCETIRLSMNSITTIDTEVLNHTGQGPKEILIYGNPIDIKRIANNSTIVIK